MIPLQPVIKRSQEVNYRLYVVMIFLLMRFSAICQTKLTSPFNKIRIYSNVNVKFYNSADKVFSISYPFVNNEQDSLLVTIENETLTISTNDNSCFSDTVVINGSKLISVENAYEGTLSIDSIKNVDRFKATLQGNGRIVIQSVQTDELEASIITGNGLIEIKSGHCSKIKGRIIGTGTIIMMETTSVKTVLSGVGTGTIFCPITNELKITDLGTTKILYKGIPQIKRRGMVKLYKIDN